MARRRGYSGTRAYRSAGAPRGSGGRAGNARPGPARRRAATQLGRIATLLEAQYGKPGKSSTDDLVGGLVRTILSQNTTDTNSTRAYLELRERFPLWSDVETADLRALAAAIRSGGLARVKARRIRDILRAIRAESGELDLGFLRERSTDDIMRYLRGLTGVGQKTAACVALFDLGRETLPVDTHVHRVVGRLGVVGKPRTRDATFEALRSVVPVGLSLSLHVNMIHLGREFCRPRNPACGACPVRSECRHFRGAAGESG